MKYVLKNQEMQKVDKETIERIGIPGLVLMERAALATAQELKKRVKIQDKILVIAGIGNNGGDALGVARILLEGNYLVQYIVVGGEEHYSKDLKTQLGILNRLGAYPVEQVDMDDYEWIVEGIFGVGLSREVSGEFKDMILAINESKANVMSIDIPSGISGDTGKVLGCGIRANVTVTYGAKKRGHLLYPGREYAGEIITADIGFFDDTFTKYATGITYDLDDLNRIPKRKKHSNKGTYGKVLIVAGQKGMAGAAYFAGKAAYRMGSGLVKISTHEENRIILQSKIPEAVIGRWEELEQDLQWCDSIVFGPGLGVSEETKQLFETILQKGKTPLVIDADGLNTMSYYKMKIEYDYGCIFTPHVGEAARLLNVTIQDVLDNLTKAATDLSEKYHGTIVLKDAATLVVSEHDAVYFNQSGNHGMATGGSGDVLSGIIGSLTGRKISVKKAAKLGVYIHGLSGDEAAKEKGENSMIASDIVESLSKIVGGN
ncbi:MAG: NAD(P)H-hydrate dehydratase [Anaerostipes sp.]|nr:NAD(P)H-hydrate dehydratase [Anaerostipes sp.]